MRFCFDIAPWACAEYLDTFPFWELLISVAAAAVVTAVTIWVSVRESRRATDAALNADRIVRIEDAAKEMVAREREQEQRRLEDENRSSALRRIEANDLVDKLQKRLVQVAGTPVGVSDLGEDAEWRSMRFRLMLSPSLQAGLLVSWVEQEIRLMFAPDELQHLVHPSREDRRRAYGYMAEWVARWAERPEEAIRHFTDDRALQREFWMACHMLEPQVDPFDLIRTTGLFPPYENE